MQSPRPVMGRGFPFRLTSIEPVSLPAGFFLLVLLGFRSSSPETPELRWQTIGSSSPPILAGFGNFPLAADFQIVGLVTFMMRTASFTSIISRSAFRLVSGMPVSRSESSVSMQHQPSSGLRRVARDAVHRLPALVLANRQRSRQAVPIAAVHRGQS